MAQQGWYPDPGGQAGMYRYWDGQSWSEVISPTPLSGPPSQFTAPSAPTTPSGGGTSQPGANQSSSGAYGQYQQIGQLKPKKRVGPVIAIIVGLIVVALIVWFVATQLGGGTGGGINPTDPSSQGTGEVCPKMPIDNDRADHPNDGRVYGGDLSYPRLPGPWSPVDEHEVRVPFGRDVAQQTITIHENYQFGYSWVAAFLIGELYAGDGFYEPEEASRIVNRCIFGAFYGDNKVETETLRSEPFSVDGLDGWITETNLSFSIPNLPTTSELAIVIIVKTSAMSSSIVYASIPNDAMQYKPDVDAAIAGLRAHT